MLSQIETAIETTGAVLAGRSETLVVVVLLVIFIAFVLWRDWQVRKADAKAEQRRQDREDKRETIEKERADKQLLFLQELGRRNSDQIDLMGSALDRTSHATETMATSAQRTERSLELLTNQQLKDRSAIIDVIDATEAQHRGESDKAAEAFRRARDHLMNDR